MANAMIVTLSFLISLTQSTASTNNITPFEVNEIISKIMYRPIREGSRFILYGKAYQVEYREDGLLLHAFNSKVDNGKDIIIPGKPEIKGNRISYRDNKDKIIIQGFTQKSKIYEKSKINSSFQDYLKNIPNLFKNKLEPGNETDFLHSGEFLVDTSIIPVPTPGFQGSPVIAFDGTNYLVVWEDWVNYSDIYFARVNQSGVVLDFAGIPLSTANGYQTHADVIFDGTNYFVVWEDWRRGLSADIYGARINTAGLVLDPYGIPISTAIDEQWSPTVAFDGTNYFVVWEDWRNQNFDIYGTRINQYGITMNPSGISISSNVETEVAPSIIFGSSNYLLVWETWYSMDSADLFCTRISSSGAIIDPNGVTISNAPYYQNQSSVVFDGTNYFVVWQDSRDTISDIYGARINQSAVVLDPSGIAISIATNCQFSPEVAFDGTNYLVIWEDCRNNPDTSDVYCARVNQSGSVLDPGGIAISTAQVYQWLPSIGFDGTNYLVVWEDWRQFDFCDVYCTRVNQAGNILDPSGLIITTAANEQFAPAAAFDGTYYFVVWEDRRGSSSDIYGTRINQTGTIVDPNIIVISTAANNQSAPAIAFDGNNYLVVWEDYRNGIDSDIYCTKVNQNGIVLDPSGIQVSNAPYNQISPSVAFNGTYYLAVWEDYRNNDTSDIYGARINQTGFVLDPSGIPIVRKSFEQESPKVASDWTNFLVVWQDDRRGRHWDNIFGVRIDTAGLNIDTADIVICEEINWQYSPAVAFDGINYFVVWEDHRNGLNTEFYGTKINTDGIVLDSGGLRIFSSSIDQRIPPTICFNGTDYIMVWEDYRNGYYSDIYGAKINRSGNVLSLYPVSIRTGSQCSPALVNGLGNQVLINYSGWTGEVQGKFYNSVRIWGKLFTGLEQFPNFGWSRQPDVIATYRPVKDGGCLTAMGDKIFALVGNNTRDFVVYDINTNTWTKVGEVPFSSITGKTKKVKKGACICNDGYYIYIIKGNNTQEFYRYDPYVNLWQELPQPGFYKRIKGGSMAFDGESKIYLIGGRKKEWKVFDIYTETWSMPYPETLPERKWKYGSFILYIDDVIYGLRGYSKTNEFYKLDIYSANPGWIRLQDMPLYNSYGRKKKAKKGACGAYDGKFIYALKGGNTYDFYSYDIEKDSWTQREDIGQPVGIPKRKVKGGGAITYSPITGGLFALVGNRTNEFWFYLPNPGFGTNGKLDEGKMAKPNQLNNFDLQILPNPSKNITKLYYSLPVKITANVKIYNVTGKLILQAESDYKIFTINTKPLSAGVYMLKFEAGDYKATKKLLVAH